MTHRFVFGVFAIMSLAASGCLTKQVTNDSRNFRLAVQDLYFDQAVDNLILAYNNQPFIHIAYTDLIVTDSLNSKANGGDEYDPTNAKTILTATGALLNTSRSYVNHVLFGANVENDRQLQLTSDPVVGKDKIYDYYRAFARDPELFCCCDDEPDFPVYLKMQRDCRWYFIPCGAGGVFQYLVLKTSLMLGEDDPPPVFWTTQITSVKTKTTTFRGTKYIYDIEFTPPVPVDTSSEMIVKARQCTEEDQRYRIKLVGADRNQPVFSQVRITEETEIPDLTGRTVNIYTPSNPNWGEEAWESVRLNAALEAFIQSRPQSR